jgi:hypothetical protein
MSTRPDFGPAYDYDRQEWIHGAAAIPLHLRSVREQLACLTGARAADYAHFAGIADVAAAVAELEAQESDLMAADLDARADDLSERGAYITTADAMRAQATQLRSERSAAA